MAPQETVLDLIAAHDGDRTRNGEWVDVRTDDQPAGTALVELTDTDGRITRHRITVTAA